jgi:outer membrane lipoprotein SlyB
VGATLLVGGTTDSPLIFPAPSSLIGSVIGGSVGGPVGAAIGAKAGEVLEDIGGAVKGIFGK